MTNLVKLTKVTEGYDSYYLAEDSKYFTEIRASKHYSYSVTYKLKEGISSGRTCYYGTMRHYDLRLLKDVKAYIAQLDEEFETALAVAKAEEEAREKAWAERKAREEELNVFASKTSYLPEVGEMLELRSANLNKNCTIGEYRLEVEKGNFRTSPHKVEKVVTMSTEEYDNFALSLMDNHEFLKDCGGCGSDDPRLEGREYMEVINTPELKAIYFDTMYTSCVAIVALGRETIYADPSGYSYARYVAFA